MDIERLANKVNPKYSISISLGDSHVINSFTCSQQTFNDFLDLSFQVSLDIIMDNVGSVEKRGVNFSSFPLDRCPWSNCSVEDLNNVIQTNHL
jgi:hypothetical protein